MRYQLRDARGEVVEDLPIDRASSAAMRVGWEPLMAGVRRAMECLGSGRLAWVPCGRYHQLRLAVQVGEVLCPRTGSKVVARRGRELVIRRGERVAYLVEE